MSSSSSLLFQPYRAIGFVCDSTPFHFKRLGQQNFVTLAIGKAWQVFNVSKALHLHQSPCFHLYYVLMSYVCMYRDAL